MAVTPGTGFIVVASADATPGQLVAMLNGVQALRRGSAGQ